MKITKKIDELTFEEWYFIIIDNKLVLNGYYIIKKVKRKLNTIIRYDRILSRHNNISENDIPFTDELKAEALNLYASSIKVIKWSER